MTKLTEALRDVVKVAGCDHQFAFVRDTIGDGVVGLCDRCKAQITTWPGLAHYEPIAAARPASGSPSSL